MAIVIRSGDVAIGDAIRVALPPAPHRPLDVVLQAAAAPDRAP